MLPRDVYPALTENLQAIVKMARFSDAIVGVSPTRYHEKRNE
jgi:hypothetical protein